MRVQPGPVNDYFVAATVATAGSSYAGSTVGATHEASETILAPGSVGSIWYNWITPSAGTFTFQTLGTAWDTVMGVYVNSTGKLPATAVRLGARHRRCQCVVCQ